MTIRDFKAKRARLRWVTVALVAGTVALSGCTTQEVLNQGYVVDQGALELTPVGSSREQVLLSLGTPSTTATFDNEVFYYISQRRTRAALFLKPQLRDQSVLAVYFDPDGVVNQIANYTLQDGKAFDMIARVTPTGGKDQSFLIQMLTGATGSRATQNALGRAISGGNRTP